jgi:hypothetical protein
MENIVYTRGKASIQNIRPISHPWMDATHSVKSYGRSAQWPGHATSRASASSAVTNKEKKEGYVERQEAPIQSYLVNPWATL